MRAVALSTRSNLFTALVLRRTLANGNSTTSVVHRCFQWTSGKSPNATMRSQSSLSAFTAFGYQGS